MFLSNGQVYPQRENSVTCGICLFLTIVDFVFFDVILSFQDVSGWKLRKIAKDLGQIDWPDRFGGEVSVYIVICQRQDRCRKTRKTDTRKNRTGQHFLDLLSQGGGIDKNRHQSGYTLGIDETHWIQACFSSGDRQRLVRDAFQT
jgi:hypothetical protein